MMNTNNEMAQSQTQQQSLELYLESLSEHERHAYEIARSHLQSMFSLKKSNGFVKWSKTVPVVQTQIQPST